MFTTGQKISGTYHGEKFSGTVTGLRVVTTTHKYEYNVELDTPITVYSWARGKITFGEEDRGVEVSRG
jgi:hypothetical protein